MKSFFAIIFLFNITNLTYSQITYFETEFPGLLSTQSGTVILNTSDNGIVILGDGDDPLTSYTYLIRMNESGDTLWTRTFARLHPYIHYQSLIELPDSGFVFCGDFDSTLDVVRTNKFGDTVWTRQFIVQNCDFDYSKAAQSGNGFVIGGTLSFGTDRDAYYIAIDTNGQFVNERRFEIPGPQTILDFTATNSNFYFVGFTPGDQMDDFFYLITQGSSVYQCKRYKGPSHDWGYRLTSGNYISGISVDAFLHKKSIIFSLYGNGQVEWAKEYWSNELELRSLKKDNQNSLFAVGTKGNADPRCVLWKMDAQGNINFSKEFQLGIKTGFADVTLANNGSILLTGSIEIPGLSDYGIYVAKVDSQFVNGCFAWNEFVNSDSITITDTVLTATAGLLNSIPVHEPPIIGSGLTMINLCTTMGINKDYISDINVFPNPLSQNEDLNILGDGKATIQVFDISNRCILNETQYLPASLKLNSKGSFIVRVQTGEKIYWRKIFHL